MTNLFIIEFVSKDPTSSQPSEIMSTLQYTSQLMRLDILLAIVNHMAQRADNVSNGFIKRSLVADIDSY